MPSDAEQRGGDGEEERVRVLSALTAGVVRIYKERFGRGPVRARSHFAGPDTVICVLEETLTPIELTLVKLGEHARLRDLRTFYQYASDDLFKQAAEAATGRRVRSFMSGVDTTTDMACEVFVFEPVV